MQTFSGRRASQHPEELACFLGLLRAEAARSYLEIGARHGDTFHAVMCALPRGSSGLAVDLPGGAWGIASSRPALDAAVADLVRRGYKVKALYGDSRGTAVRAALQGRRFDAVLIDGDHSYEGVAADWDLCRRLAPLVALHDIAGAGQIERQRGAPVEVPRLWQELTASCRRVQEIVAPGSTMGIGVAWP